MPGLPPAGRVVPLHTDLTAEPLPVDYTAGPLRVAPEAPSRCAQPLGRPRPPGYRPLSGWRRPPAFWWRPSSAIAAGASQKDGRRKDRADRRHIDGEHRWLVVDRMAERHEQEDEMLKSTIEAVLILLSVSADGIRPRYVQNRSPR